MPSGGSSPSRSYAIISLGSIELCVHYIIQIKWGQLQTAFVRDIPHRNLPPPELLPKIMMSFICKTFKEKNRSLVPRSE